MQPIPVQRYLVSAQKLTTPDGFTQVDVRILTGLPYPIPLTSDLQLIVVLPTGLAVPWRDADATAIASNSEAELSPAIPQTDFIIGDVTRAPFRLVVQQSRRTIGIIPLVAGLRRVVPDSGFSNLGGQIELMILEWDIRAGSVRGAGDFDSRLSFAWRRANQSTTQFSSPPINSMLTARLQLKRRVMQNALQTIVLQIADSQFEAEVMRAIDFFSQLSYENPAKLIALWQEYKNSRISRTFRQYVLAKIDPYSS